MDWINPLSYIPGVKQIATFEQIQNYSAGAISELTHTKLDVEIAGEEVIVWAVVK